MQLWQMDVMGGVVLTDGFGWDNVASSIRVRDAGTYC